MQELAEYAGMYGDPFLIRVDTGDKHRFVGFAVQENDKSLVGLCRNVSGDRTLWAVPVEALARVGEGATWYWLDSPLEGIVQRIRDGYEGGCE